MTNAKVLVRTAGQTYYTDCYHLSSCLKVDLPCCCICWHETQHADESDVRMCGVHCLFFQKFIPEISWSFQWFSTGGQWNVEDLEAKLAEQQVRTGDLRSEARMLAETKGVESSPKSSPDAKDSPKRFSFSSAASVVEAPPVLAGLSVQDLLRSHRVPSLSSGQCLLDELQNSIETDTAPQTQDSQGACASQSMRLSQIAYGYHGVSIKGKSEGSKGLSGDSTGLHKGQSQLETPLQHRNAWNLLPIRKPLLTKRSRRCKLLKTGENGQSKACKGLVVKPQINPCANPAFQKNNVAVNFVPSCSPWSCREDGSNGTYQVILILSNPMDSDLEMQESSFF